MLSRLVGYSVDKCQYCEKAHDYQLEVQYQLGTVLFGGRNENSKSSTWDVLLDCPDTKKSFTRTVSIKSQSGEEIEGVRLHTSNSQSSAIQPSSPESPQTKGAMDVEFEEWIKSSLTNARDYCKVMVTTTIGAIPIFFTVLKYLGTEKASNYILSFLGIMPPTFFIGSAIIFIFALQPQYGIVYDLSSFIQFRAQRLRLMNILIQIGTGLFMFGVCFTVGIFVYLL